MADKLTMEQFAKSIKAKYPQYASVPDDTLAQAMLKKYPQYADRVAAPEARDPNYMWPTTATFSAYHPAKGVLPRAEQLLDEWRTKLQSNVEVNPAIHKDTSGEFMASAPLGILRLLKGVTEVPQGKVRQGTKDVVGGGLQAAEIPSMMMTPELGELGVLPSTAKAGKLFDPIEKAAGHLPINLSGPGRRALEMYERSELATSLPQVVRKFLRRATGPDAKPLTFREARMIYSEAGRLSADELSRLSPPMKRQLAQFVHELGQSLEETAGRVGQSGAYRNALKSYQRASRFEELKKEVVKKGLPAAAKAAGVGAAATAGGALAYKAGKATGVIP